MFDLFFESVQAYNQIGLFIGALVCLGLGGLILGDSLYWRLHALRASGTIIGVVSRGGTYSAVYRYSLPDGETHVAKSNSGSSSVRGKETGRVVPLLISAHNPTEAQEANSHLFDIIGLVLIGPGVWLGYTALTAYPITPMTWIMAGALLIYLAERGYRILVPKGQRRSIAEWRKQRGLDADGAIDLKEVKRAEDILSSGVGEAEQRQLQSSRKAAPLVGLLAIILICAGIFESIRIAKLEAVGLRAQGEVVGLKQEGSSGHVSYYAIVRYRTNNNETVEFKDDVGSNPPGHRPGDRLTVLYFADNPRKEAIVDRGIWWNWAIPGILILIAAFLLWLLIAILRTTRPEKSSDVLAHKSGAEA
jgi:hypothetical protein